MIVNEKFELKISHRLWKDALSISFSLLTMASPGEVICITGPSRAGKTKLIKELCKMLTGFDEDDKKNMTAIIVDAANTGPHGSFSTKSFIFRMLEAIEHPMFFVKGDDMGVHENIWRKTEAHLRMTVERGLRARGVKYLFIDEAQHAKYASNKSQGSFAVIDSWKCLAHSAGVVLIVVGAYPVLNILRRSPHLLGRKYQVHLPRYLPTPNDLSEFAQIISAYEKELPVNVSNGGLINNLELLYQGTLGCIGLLRKWLVWAHALAQSSGGNITVEILKKTRMSDDDLEEIEKEICEGEALLANGMDDESCRSQVTSSKEKKKGKNKPFQKLSVRRGLGHRN